MEKSLYGRKFCARELIKNGMSVCQISKITKLSRQTIYNIIKGKVPMARKPRKQVITEEMSKFLKIFLSRHSSYMGGSLEKIKKALNETFDCKFKSVCPIRTWLKRNKYKSVNKILVDPLPKRNILKRLFFCKKFVKDNSISRKILFTDEKTFAVKTKFHKGDKMRIQHGSKDHYNQAIIHNNEFVKIAAGISYYGKTNLIFLPKKFNSKVYSEQVLPIYLEEMSKHNLKYFMQDNSGIHLEKRNSMPVLGQFENILNWPPRSPDLNPIENLWAYLSLKLRNRKYENQRQLRMVLSEEYDKIPMSILENLCGSFRKRLSKCIEKKGQIVNLTN